MASKSSFTAGRFCLTLAALSCSISCYIADWNETHIKNPKWPPHARFHNGQTMSTGLLLGLITLYFTWRPTFAKSTYDPHDSTWCAAVIASVYWIAGLSAIFYPGTKWMDPEFGEGAPQLWIFSLHIVLAWLGYALETRRLGAAKAVATPRTRSRKVK